MIYQKEQGAINESLSDIWGAMVEYYTDPNKDTYSIAEDCHVGSSPIRFRSMANPKLEGHPDTYKGQHWIPTDNCNPSRSNDECGVHTNSGVMNKWFYLLAEGGKGINDVKNYYTVYGIGKEEAAKIVYRAETVYFESRTNYEEARMWTMQAAMDLYGANSHQLYAVCLAWYAVGIGELGNLCNTDTFIITGGSVGNGTTGGDNNICDFGSRIYELVFLPPNATVTWEISPNLKYGSASQGYESVTVQINTDIPPSQYLGAAYVIATVNGVSIRKDIWIGDPQVNIRLEQTTPYQVNVHLEGENGTDITKQGIINVAWQLVNSTGNCNPTLDINTNFLGLVQGNCNNWSSQLQITVTNECGTISLTKDITSSGYLGGGGDFPCYTIVYHFGYPIIVPCGGSGGGVLNPNGRQENQIQQFTIYDYMGMPYGRYENTNVLPTSKLPFGLYLIKGIDKEENLFTLKYLKK